jgi:acetyl esterase/lipase
VVDPPRLETAKVEDDLVPGPMGGIPLRWYRPSPEGGLLVTLFFHGGGWTVDDLNTTATAAAAWPVAMTG